MKVAVVTPTIGNEKLLDCLASVDAQTYKDIIHYIFIDGKGWYGHRVFAACSFLVNADIIVYLDEDNWFEPCHVKKLVDKINEGNDWAYSLRKIYDKDGNFL